MHRLIVVLVLLGSAGLAAQSTRIPSPESVIGFAPGAEHKLATYDQTIDYFKKLDAASDQMTLVDAGTSTQGRTLLLRADLVEGQPARRSIVTAKSRGGWRGRTV